MLDVLSALQTWRAGGRCAVAAVVRTWSSAPLPVGALMAVGPDGRVVGAVSGGCVEGDVHRVAMQVIHDGTPVLVSYGVSDDDAFAVGLTCGGTIDVLVTPVTTADTWVDELAEAVAAHRSVTLRTVVDGVATGSRTVAPGVDGDEPELREEAAGRVLVQPVVAPAHLLVYGANDYAVALTEVGRLLAQRVVVCDARPVFATPQRFPAADEVVVDWPHRHFASLLDAGLVDERTAVCALTHDAKFDLPLLELALRSPAGYVGALGSRRTCAERAERLAQLGMTDDELARLRSPIGLHIGARTPQEVAVSIAAEIISTRRRGTGAPLRTESGPIHA